MFYGHAQILLTVDAALISSNSLNQSKPLYRRPEVLPARRFARHATFQECVDTRDDLVAVQAMGLSGRIICMDCACPRFCVVPLGCELQRADLWLPGGDEGQGGLAVGDERARGTVGCGAAHCNLPGHELGDCGAGDTCEGGLLVVCSHAVQLSRVYMNWHTLGEEE